MLQSCAYAGNDACVREIEAACIERAPSSHACLHFRAEQADHRGECAAYETLTQQSARAIATETGNTIMDTQGYLWRAAALAANGRSRLAIQEQVDRAAASADDERDYWAAWLNGQLAALFGDFEAAEGHAAKLREAVADSHKRTQHAAQARLATQLALEVGDTPRALALAQDFLARRDGWAPAPSAEDFALALDPTPLMLRVVGAYGGDARARALQRARWFDDWKQRYRGPGNGFLWLYGWAATAFDETSAREALAHRAEFEPISPFRPRSMTELDEGRMYLLLERWNEAEERLRRASSVCRALTFPFEHVRAHELLGRALEAKGDSAGACAAYQQVLDRWGAAKATSVTAQRARSRIEALDCPP